MSDAVDVMADAWEQTSEEQRASIIRRDQPNQPSA